MHQAIDNLLDILFPYFCYRCNQEGHAWCRDASTNLPWPTCWSCRRPYHPLPEKGCTRPTPIIAIGHYRDPALRGAIHDWKYEGQWGISKAWAPDLARLLSQFGSDEELVPTPLVWRRQLHRGYNQAELLARDISRLTGQVVTYPLRRIGSSIPQAQLPVGPERLANIRNKFICDLRQAPRAVWVVDDVMTTGATLEELTHALTRAGWPVRGYVVVAKAHA